jgi:hypothetical protein
MWMTGVTGLEERVVESEAVALNSNSPEEGMKLIGRHLITRR